MTAVAGAAAPPSPFIVPAAPAVVQRTVGQHELHIAAQGGDHIFEHRLIISRQRIEGKGWERLLDVVAEVHRTAILFGESSLWMTFAE